MKALLAAVAIFTATATGAFGQVNQNKTMTNCPPENPSNAQEIEKSAILPDADGKHSAAPTVQRDGKSVEVDPRCAEDPNRARK